MKKISVFIMTLLCLLSITSCKAKVESISVVATSIPEVINVAELDSKLATIKIDVVDSKGKTETINLDKSMISDTDYAKLSGYGTYTVSVTYEDVTTNLTLNLVTNNYAVKVVYPDNTPVTSGVSVQWCTGNNCFLPEPVNSQGIAEIELDDGDYYIHIEGVPTGYTYDPNAYTTSADNKFVEIKLLQLSTISSGSGTETSPYVVSVGTYNLTFETAGNSGMKYYSFTALEDATYTIKSISMDKLAMNLVDPYIAFLGSENSMVFMDISGNVPGNINFTHEFEAEAGVTYKFIILVSSANQFPAEFEIVISK